jgi:hypothetical protein
MRTVMVASVTGLVVLDNIVHGPLPLPINDRVMFVNDTNAMRDPRTLTTLPEILSCLSVFQAEEAELSSSLAELLKARDPIISSLERLQSLVPQLNELQADASALTKKVSHTAKTAERVGSNVRALDEEMRRVREAGDRVGLVMDLKVRCLILPFHSYSNIVKSSLLALQASVERQDWESAARHCARAMTIPPEIISGPFAESVVVRTLLLFFYNYLT